MAGIPAAETRVPMKLKVPDGTEPPVGLAGYRALDGAERTAIRTAYGPDVHVRVEGSGLHKACPSLPYVIDNDVAYLPLHIVESFYVRLMRLAPGVRHDLTVMVDPSALAEVERVALEQGLDASPTTPTVYLQRPSPPAARARVRLVKRQICKHLDSGAGIAIVGILGQLKP